MRNPLPSEGRFIQEIEPTPLIPVRLGDGPRIWCKLEFLNPSGSIKDRIARYMLEKAWRRGDLHPEREVVEASSGSTSIALALACAQLGVGFTAVMPESVSRERQLMIRAFGAKIVLTPKAEGMLGTLSRAQQIARENDALATLQFENQDNCEAHRMWTGQEILAQIPGGSVHAVVSGVGTGGTIVGLYEAFKESGCDVIPFAARPILGTAVSAPESCSFSGRVPGVVDGMSKLYQEADLEGLVELDVEDDLAISKTKELHRKGFPVGPSSGLNFAAAEDAARRLGPEAKIVTVFPDRMERYFSTELFAE